MSQLADVDYIYLSGISLAILPCEDRKELITQLQLLSEHGVKLVFDTNYRPMLWQDADTAKACYQDMFAITDLALVTNDDELQLWGDKDEKQTLERLESAGVKEAVVKMGERGNIHHYFGQSQQTKIDAIAVDKVVDKVVDTTSAGDAFNAGYLAGVLLGKTPCQASKQGHRLASMVIQHRGAIISAQAMADIDFTLLSNK